MFLFDFCVVSKITIGLAAILGVSLFVNYQFYQNNKELGSQILDLNQQIDHFQKQTGEIQKQIESLASKSAEIEKLRTQVSQKQLSKPLEISSSESITAVAVRSIVESDGFFQQIRYSGTTMKISVDIKDGSGLVLVNTAIPTGVDFQTSAKTAVQVAQNYTKTDLSNKDIIFSISSENENELQAVDGPSAGMAMTVLLVKEIQGKPVSEKILLTGTIQDNGIMGPVGGVPEKAEVAGKFGAELFIVPKGQAITYVQECEERKEGPFLYRNCKSEAKDLSPIIEQKYGMKVVEASDLSSVLKYYD